MKKKILLIILAVTAIAAIVFAALQIRAEKIKKIERQRAEQDIFLAVKSDQKLNKKFIYDDIKIINNLHSGLGNLKFDGSEFQVYSSFYDFEAQVENSKKIIKEWDSVDGQKKKSVDEFNSILDDFKEGIKNYTDGNKTTDVQKLSLGVSKIKSAKNSLIYAIGSIAIECRLSLSDEDRRDIIKYIDDLEWYKKIAKDYSKTDENTNKSFKAPEEFWALTVLRNSLDVNSEKIELCK